MSAIVIPRSTLVTERDGLRHQIASFEEDRRVVLTRCGIRVAAIGSRPDPSSEYQRATRHDWHPTPCPRCFERRVSGLGII